MTLVDCLKSLFKEDDINPLSPEELRVYITLLKEWNKLGRPEWFEYRLALKVKPNVVPNMIPKSTLMRIRDRLVQRGLIQYVSGNGKVKNPCFKMCCETKGGTNSETKSETNSKEKVSPTPPLKENITELEEKEKTTNVVSKKDKLSSPTKSERMDWASFEKTFNEMMPPNIPRIKGVKEDRRKLVKARINEYSKEDIMVVFNKIVESDFLSGRNRKPGDTWKCNFDFIFSKDGFRKILEGNYDNGEQIQRNTASSFTSKQEANEYALNQFARYREARESGLLDEVEKPF